MASIETYLTRIIYFGRKCYLDVGTILEMLHFLFLLAINAHFILCMKEQRNLGQTMEHYGDFLRENRKRCTWEMKCVFIGRLHKTSKEPRAIQKTEIAFNNMICKRSLVSLLEKKFLKMTAVEFNFPYILLPRSDIKIFTVNAVFYELSSISLIYWQI